MGKSRFVIFTLVSFIVGIFLGDIIPVDLWWLVGIGAGILLALILQWREKYWRMELLIIIGLIMGLGYFNFWDNRQKSIELPYGNELAIEGQIIGHPDFSGNFANYVLRYEGARIRLTAERYPEFHYGDILRFKGAIKEPYPYFFHQGILGQIFEPQKLEKVGYQGNIAIRIIYQIRDKFEESLNRNLTEPYASFAAGLVLGSKRNIPDSLMNDFRRTGTTHIIAVSGYNLTILITYIAIFFGIFSRRLKFWGTIFIIFCFIIMTGAPASVVRAGILAGLVALGHFEGRRINMTILLLLVAAVMLFFNPYALKYDVGFQLSFLAFAGLIYLSPIINQLQLLKYLPEKLRSTLSETIAAQLMVFPILLVNFGQASVISPVANILILWLIPLSMLVVFLIGVAGLIFSTLGHLLGLFGVWLLKYIIVVTESFSKIPWASYSIRVDSWWWLPIFYFLIGFWIYWNYLKCDEKNQVQKI